MDKAEHQKRGEPEQYAAENEHGGNGIADRPWFGGIAEPGNIRHHPGDGRQILPPLPVRERQRVLIRPPSLVGRSQQGTQQL
jgi:hypothetical protein